MDTQANISTCVRVHIREWKVGVYTLEYRLIKLSCSGAYLGISQLVKLNCNGGNLEFSVDKEMYILYKHTMLSAPSLL